MNNFDYKNMTPFKWFVLENFPFIENDFDAINNYHLFSKVVEYLNKTIDNMNLTGKQMENLTNAMTELQNYVNNYFDNLDVQEEINQKLDEMTEDGTLENIFGKYVDDYLNPKFENLQTQINALSSGSPLVASSISEMTDTSRVYVNTSDGNWYYYNGSIWVSGGIYQGTSVSDTDPTILEMNARLNQYMNHFYFDENSTFNTPFKIKNGQKLYLKVLSITGQINVFTKGFSDTVYYEINKPGNYYITATNDGEMRFYFTGEGNIKGYCYIENELQSSINELSSLLKVLSYNYISNAPTLNTIKLKKNKVYENFQNLTKKSYIFDVHSTIENYSNYEITSSVSYPTPLIRVRDNLGNLIYNLNIENFENIKPYNDGAAFWAFDKNGKFLRVQRYNDLKERGYILADDEYYVILNKYPDVSAYVNYDWIIENINIDWLNNKNAHTYYIGSGKDFETFTEMLIGLENDNSEKTVYVESGTYDIFNEMGGADYISTLIDSASSLNWRDVCHVVPENTHIIGIGEVNLTWIATPEQMQSQAVAFLFSPLNVSGNCTIENINVIAQNCRYAVHDETSGLAKYNGAIHRFKNCKIEYKNSTYGIGFPYGAGHNRNMKLYFDNCTFKNYGRALWSSHDWNYPANSPALFEMNNCIFTRENETLTDGYIRFSSADTVGKKDIVKINNCYINGDIVFSTEGTQNVQQGYDVTLIGSSLVDVQYSDYVTTRYGIKQYNSHN